jgi:hypothetical protein
MGGCSSTALAYEGEECLKARDPAQLAKLIVDIATGGVEDREIDPTSAQDGLSASEAHRRPFSAACH